MVKRLCMLWLVALPAGAQAAEAIEQAAAGATPPEPVASPEPADDEPVEPEVHHTPPLTHLETTPLEISVAITHHERVARALLVHRKRPSDPPRVVVLRRGSGGSYRGSVPSARVARPALYYSIELELDDGTRREVFASRSAPHRVQILEDAGAVVERERLARLDGRRSQVEARGEYVSFGTSGATVLEGDVPRRVAVDDRYWRVEGAYRYRMLGFVAHLGMRAGVLRGRAPVAPSERPDAEDRFEVGLDYAAPEVRFRLHDAVYADVALYASLSEAGFGFGGGGALLVGDPARTHLALGFHGIEGAGFSAQTRLALAPLAWLSIAPAVELTNLPSAEAFGVRLLGDVAVTFGGFTIGARGGYQAREATSGGPTAGGTVAYAF